MALREGDLRQSFTERDQLACQAVWSTGQLWRTSFHRAKYGRDRRIRGRERSPKPRLNRIRNPHYQQQLKNHLTTDSKSSKSPLALRQGGNGTSRQPWCLCVYICVHAHADSSSNVHEQFPPRTAYQQDSYEKMIKANIITSACLTAG